MGNQPNILFAIADDASLHFGAYGCPWVHTPAFDRVAREGILFTNAFTPNAKCAPSRAAILTGRNSWQLEDAANHQCYFPARFKTVWEALAENGYFTGRTAKGWAPGDPGTKDGSPRELAGPAWGDRTHEPPTERMNRTDYAANFEDFLDARPGGTPFCFWYGCTEPHRPYTYRSGIELGGRSVDEIDHVYGIWPDTETVRTDLLDYGFAIEQFDRHLGRMLDALEERGELENTLVVATSDNGMPFPRVKGQEYYISNHLPLAIRWPAGVREPGRTVEELVSFIDFAPTFLEAAGLEERAAGMEPITGRSLFDIFRGEPGEEREFVLIGKERHDIGRPGEVGYPIRGIFRDGFLYLRNFEPDRWPAGNPETGYPNSDGSPTKTEILRLRDDPEKGHFWQRCFDKRPAEEFYNIAADQDCLQNLAGEPAHADQLQALREIMERELRAQGDPRLTGGAPLDENPIALERCRGHYERVMAGTADVPGWIEETDIQPPG
jgi:arylsulfatase A-like enzyme